MVQPHLKFAQVPRAGGVVTEGVINAATAASLIVGATETEMKDSLQDGWWSGVRDGYDLARKVIEDKFFGGPTKDMILGWLAEHDPSAEPASPDALPIEGEPK